MAKANAGSLHVSDVPEENKTQVPATPETTERTYADGKYNSADDLEKGYGELKGKIDGQGREVGSLRAENKSLKTQIEKNITEASKREESAKNAPPPTDYEKLQGELAASYENGDIDFNKYARESQSLTAKAVQSQAQEQMDEVLGQATEQFNNTLAERDNNAVVSEFHKTNPDFADMEASGALDDMIVKNPMHDKFSAYWEMKASQAKADGMQEQARIEEGSKPAGKVLSDPGTAMQTPTKKPVTEAERKASMSAAIA